MLELPVGIWNILMKQFLTTNTVTYNLMAFTAFKSILIFSELLKSPKSYQDLQQIILNHEYLHEKISIDTLRIYINTLKEFGCQITKKKYDGVTKFSIESHPFSLKFTQKQIKGIIKVYKAISKSIEVDDLISLQKFFNKISAYVEDEELKTKLENLSPFNNIKESLIEELMGYVHNNTEIVVLYNSPNSGKKNITIVVDKLYIENGKLYVSGFNSEHNTYSSFLVAKIIKIVSVNLNNKTLIIPEITVGYVYRKDVGEVFELIHSEKIIKTEDNKELVEITSRNKFEIMQRIFSLSSKCTVLYPEDFKKYIITNLKKMKEGYIEK